MEAREPEDLYNSAYKFWPESIASLERSSSIIPKLLATQNKFISLLNIASKSPDAWKSALDSTSELSGNLFLKHLMVLSDVGGERLMRFKAELPSVFTDGHMYFIWNSTDFRYKFNTLSESKNWSNPELKVDGSGLALNETISPAMEDVAMLLLFGGSATAENLPIEIQEKCVIGTLIGQEAELEAFVRSRYIWVSRITGGATANALGNISQTYISQFLKKRLPDWDFTSKSIPEITDNQRTPISFDIVAKSPNGKFCAIEASFQVTTNSTIERKAGQARGRMELLHSKGHSIAYAIDGAGNFARASALATLCKFSDCTVSYQDAELEKLAVFLESIAK